MHVQVEREKRAQAAKAAAEARARKQQSWLGWLTGAGTGTAQPAGNDSDLRGDLNQEEYAKLQELVDERDAAIQAGRPCQLSGEASPQSILDASGKVLTEACCMGYCTSSSQSHY